MYEYKVKQLQIMLKCEQESAPDKAYGANLSHWSDMAKPIQIDAGGLKALIDYYSKAQETGD